MSLMPVLLPGLCAMVIMLTVLSIVAIWLSVVALRRKTDCEEDAGWVHPIRAFDEWGMTINLDEVETHDHALTPEEIAIKLKARADEWWASGWGRYVDIQEEGE